jgi:hypothetical protein
MPTQLFQKFLQLLSVGAIIGVMPLAVISCNQIQDGQGFKFKARSPAAAIGPVDRAVEHTPPPRSHGTASHATASHGTTSHTTTSHATAAPKPSPPVTPVAIVTPPTPTKPKTAAELAKAKQLQAERAGVEAATTLWMATVTSGRPQAAAEVMQLYAEDAMLLGTVSEQVRDQPIEIKRYFDYFTQLPRLSVSGYRSHIRVYGDSAINSGYYTFSYEQEGHTKVVPARFTFSYRRVNGQWLIADHHSSAIPKAPEALTPAD